MTETSKILDSRDGDEVIGALRQLSEDTAASFAEHRGLPVENVASVSGTSYLTATVYSQAARINNGDIIIHPAGTRFMAFDVAALPGNRSFDVAMVMSDDHNGIGHARKHVNPYLSGVTTGARPAAPIVLPGTRPQLG